MSLIKYGPGILQASGSIAGMTFARNRYGNYIRARTKPVNPSSALQSGIRDAMAGLAVIWSSTLTAAQRTAWNTYAAAVSSKNRLSETIYLTGFNHFCRSNIAFYETYGQYAAAGPTTLSLPETDPSFVPTISVATQQCSVAYDALLPWAGETLATFSVWMGKPRKQSQNFFAGPWKYGGAEIGVTGDPPASPFTFSVPYVAVLGQLVTLYARIRRADGRISEPFKYTTTVVA